MKVSDYWLDELEKSKALDLDLTIEQLFDTNLNIKWHQFSYTSLYNERIYGWLLEPKVQGSYPLVIDYLGYMNHLESPLQFNHWLEIGCGVLVTDSRGQGGRTLDQTAYQINYEEGLMSSGFLEKEDFYLRRLYSDALRLVDVAWQLPKVDKSKVFIHGTSQGGGVGLFTNSVTPHEIRYGFYDVPSHSNIANRVKNGTGSYQGIYQHLLKYPAQRDKIYKNLAYFDIKNIVHQIKNPVLVSVGNLDPVCPKEDFEKAYQEIKSFKELICYPEPGHGGGGQSHETKILETILKELSGEII